MMMMMMMMMYAHIGSLIVFIFVLVRLMPGVLVKGYACDHRTGLPLVYKLNGLRVLIAVVGIAATLVARKEIDGSILYLNFYESAVVANTFGILASTYFLLVGRSRYLVDQDPRDRCTTADRPEVYVATKKEVESRRNRTFALMYDFFNGMEFNPRVMGVDIKMFLYVFGAVLLELNLLSAAHVQVRTTLGHLSSNMMVYQSCFAWFLVEYLYFEHVHLYTYDLFAEKIGQKLVWGCIFFYPYFYGIGVRYLVDNDGQDEMSTLQVLLNLALFLCGWIMTRGANLQKYYLKRNPEDKFVTLFGFLTLPQRTVPGTKRRVLCSGFWGVARHLNYFGEIVQATALALPSYLWSGSLVPFVYPIYYILLFVGRVHDDDKICEKKYGKKAWGTYRSKVPYRIVPRVW